MADEGYSSKRKHDGVSTTAGMGISSGSQPAGGFMAPPPPDANQFAPLQAESIAAKRPCLENNFSGGSLCGGRPGFSFSAGGGGFSFPAGGGGGGGVGGLGFSFPAAGGGGGGLSFSFPAAAGGGGGGGCPGFSSSAGGGGFSFPAGGGGGGGGGGLGFSFPAAGGGGGLSFSFPAASGGGGGGGVGLSLSSPAVAGANIQVMHQSLSAPGQNTSLCMKIANSKIPLVIGKNKCNINWMQSKSRANIQLAPRDATNETTVTISGKPDNVKRANETTVTISGKPDNVKRAKELLDDLLSKGYCPPRQNWGYPGRPPKREFGHAYRLPASYSGAPLQPYNVPPPMPVPVAQRHPGYARNPTGQQVARPQTSGYGVPPPMAVTVAQRHPGYAQNPTGQQVARPQTSGYGPPLLSFTRGQRPPGCAQGGQPHGSGGNG